VTNNAYEEESREEAGKESGAEEESREEAGKESGAEEEKEIR